MEVSDLRYRPGAHGRLARAIIVSHVLLALLGACAGTIREDDGELQHPVGVLDAGADAGGTSVSPAEDVDASAFPPPVEDAGDPGETADGGPDAAVRAPDAGPMEPPPPPPPPPPVDGANETLSLFDGAHVYFGAENRRELNNQVDLPGEGFQYSNITLTLALRCPTGGCDAWDRHGHLSMVLNPDTPEAREVEILRFVTPYRRGMSTTLDVTDLRPLFTGRVATRVFIDTWVGPGHEAGAGWLVDAKLSFTGGPPPRKVVAVAPLWSPQGVVYGDPGRSPTRTSSVSIPEGVSGVRVWANITGHGQGNRDNCAEFCPADHTLDLGGQSFVRRIWRNDCATTAVPDQAGTWTYDRAGWCPGAIVHPWIQDLGAAVSGGMSLEVSWSPQPYENSCRPGVQSCQGCVSSSGCNYDGGAHTEPYYQLSAMLVMYR